MNKRKIAVGPGASSLILIAVVLALSVLTVLTMISARSDEGMALRSVETRQEVYGLFAQGEASLAKLDGVVAGCLRDGAADTDALLAAVMEKLPDGMRMRKDRVSWTEKSGTRNLECEVRILEIGSEARLAWTKHVLAAEDIWEDDGFDDWGDEEDWDEEAEDDENPEDEEPAEDAEEAESGDEEGEDFE